MTEVGTTLTDLTNPDNILQARFELDRAMAASGYTQCSAWAVRWGRAALDALENPELSSDEEEALRSELDKEEAKNLALTNAIDQCIAELDRVMAVHLADNSEAIDALNEVIGHLELAL